MKSRGLQKTDLSVLINLVKLIRSMRGWISLPCLISSSIDLTLSRRLNNKTQDKIMMEILSLPNQVSLIWELTLISILQDLIFMLIKPKVRNFWFLHQFTLMQTVKITKTSKTSTKKRLVSSSKSWERETTKCTRFLMALTLKKNLTRNLMTLSLSKLSQTQWKLQKSLMAHLVTMAGLQEMSKNINKTSFSKLKMQAKWPNKYRMPCFPFQAQRNPKTSAVNRFHRETSQMTLL